MSTNNPESSRSDLLYIPREWCEHKVTAEEDATGLEEEVITTAAYDEQVEEVLKPIIHRDPPEMSREEFDALSQYIETEYRLQGITIRRAIAKSSRQLRKKHDVKRIVD